MSDTPRTDAAQTECAIEGLVSAAKMRELERELARAKEYLTAERDDMQAERDRAQEHLAAALKERDEARTEMERLRLRLPGLEVEVKWPLRTPASPKNPTRLSVHGPLTGGANTETKQP